MRFPLFNVESIESVAIQGPICLPTPLGILQFNLSIGEVLLGETRHDVGGIGGSMVCSWDAQMFRAEAIYGRIRPRIPKHMTVLDCWAIVWRVQVTSSPGGIRAIAQWAPDFVWSERGPESGQFLDAQAFENAEVKLMIGTEDDEAMSRRASSDMWMPKRLTRYIETTHVPAEYRNDGLATCIPSLEMGERCQLQFVVAWEEQAPDCISSWFAVEQDPDHILKELLESR